MSTVLYNCIQIDVVKTLVYSRKPRFDGRTYQWTDHFLHVQGIVDPTYTSYVLSQQTTANVVGDGVGRGPNFIVGGVHKQNANEAGAVNANISDKTIRHLLMQPRRKLLYGVGDIGPDGLPRLTELSFRPTAVRQQDPDILTCPFADPATGRFYAVDAAYGPRPTIYNVWRIDGTGLFRVEFAVECAVNEAHLFLMKPPILLSNEWEMEHDIDRDGFATQTVNGTAVFRADVLENLQTKPDDYRQFLMLSVPPGFKREGLRVRALNNGNAARYSYTDRQLSHSILGIRFNNAPVNHSRIEAFATISQDNEGQEAALTKQVGVVGGAVGNFDITKPLSSLYNAFTETTKAAARLIPKLSVTMVVRIWGNPHSIRGSLGMLAEKIFQAKLPKLLPDSKTFIASHTRVEWQFDLLGRFVQVTKSIELPPVTGALFQAFAKIGGQTETDATTWLAQQSARLSVGGKAGAQQARSAPPAPNQNDLLPELFVQDDIFVPAAANGGNVATLAEINLGWSNDPVHGQDTDPSWPAKVQHRSAYTKLCVAAALSTWQQGPDVPPQPAPPENPAVTPNY